MKKLLLTLAGLMLTTMIYAQTTSPDATKPYVILDSSYAHTIHQSCPNEECLSKKNKKLQDAIILSEANHLEATYICTVCNHKWMY